MAVFDPSLGAVPLVDNELDDNVAEIDVAVAVVMDVDDFDAVVDVITDRFFSISSDALQVEKVVSFCDRNCSCNCSSSGLQI